MAAVWKLPIVYVLENNQYQAYTHFSLDDANAAAGDPLSKKAEAFSIPGATVDGTDPVAVRKVVAKAAHRARAGLGPSLVETKFYRLSAHGNVITVPPVPTQFPEHEAIAVYGNRKEFEQWKAKDPIKRLRARLLKDGTLTEASAKRIEAAVRAEVEDAVQFALASPLPAPEEALQYVYA
jgi:pyruvate dehydrogenase E1 component alpha subunit